ncbi:hypothetical protein REH65_32470 [Saccharopolyspora sp. ID03-671]|uniref:NAD(P)/FAD-dependent oxidoreductase n=1 Tax=Saccharopolyspora sp. ID03-671 TaxID=3073066 RepID=UPI0032506E09
MPQAAHDHVLNALGVWTLRRYAPGLLTGLLEAGARLWDLRTAAPGDVDDEDLITVFCRRSVLDLVLHRCASALPTVTISHETAVTELLLDSDRVAGVVTDSGEPLAADLVVDASGRRCASRTWLAAAGFPAGKDLTGASHLRAFGRFYRLRQPGGSPPGPLNRGNAAGGVWGHYSAVAHPADNDVFAITLGTLPGDHATTALRDPGVFTAVCGISPYLFPWVDESAVEPMGPVRVIGMPPNLLRGASPLVGLLRVGDAACVTDPMFGRGLSLAFTHAFRLADLIDRHPSAAVELGRAAADLSDELLRPWYEQSIHDSWVRVERWRAAASLPPASRCPPVPPVAPDLWAAASKAAATDPVVWQGVTRAQTSLTTPARLFADVDFPSRVRQVPAEPAPAPETSPPTRTELLQTITATARKEG